MIDAITATDTRVYAAICDKTQANQAWTPERLGNYIFAQTLITYILPIINAANTPHIIYDKGRLSGAKSTNFKTYILDKDRFFETPGIRRYPERLGAPLDVSSTTEPGLWAGDIIAGAYRHAYAVGDPTYRDKLQPNNLGRGYRYFWREK